MSWIDKELKRREAKSMAPATPRTVFGADSQTAGAGHAMQALWQKIEALNRALPELLRLSPDALRPDDLVFNTPAFRMWLTAPNGAGLGFTGEGVRYFWPVPSRLRSHNFWIHWHEEHGLRVTQRLGWSWKGDTTAEARFNEASLDHIIQCLVQGRRIRFRAVRVRRRWWPF